MKTKKPETQPAEAKRFVLTLSVKDRLVVGSLFPQKSNIINQVIARDIAKKLTIDDAEAKKVGLESFPDGRFKWNPAKVYSKEYEFTEAEMTFLKDQVSRLDKAMEITVDTLDLCQAIKES
jgi:hypothetical protein